MSGYAGRNLTLKDAAGVVIAGIRTKGVSINNEPIDVTTDDDGGVRRLLETVAGGTLEVANKMIDISFDGITKVGMLAVLRQKAADGTALVEVYTITYPDGATLVGKFAFISFEETGAYQDAVTFTGELQSTEAWVYTP